MRSLRVVIVEDEVVIAHIIQKYLEERGHTVVSHCISYEEAIESMNNYMIDVALIDIKLYGERSGIDLCQYLRKKPNCPVIVYLTAQYDNRILNMALATQPDGYLTKPIHKTSLWTTIESAYSRVQLHQSSAPSTIALTESNETHFINKNDILFVKSDHIYIEIHLISDAPITMRRSLHQIMEDIDHPHFIRCHRSYLVNAPHVTKINTHHLIVGNQKIPISRSRRKSVLNSISQLARL